MNCIEFQFKISDWLDSESPDHEVTLRKHIDVCVPCASFYQDVKSIKENSKQLEPMDPPSRIWSQLNSQLIAEGLISTREETARDKRTFWDMVFPAGVWLSLKPALSGAIVALILSTSVFYLYTRQGKQTTVSPEAAIFQELQQAELHYQKAIVALNEVSQRKIESLDPAMAQILNDNLATMDYYVKECQDAVRNSPDNPLVHRYLLTAYQKKIEIMQSIVNSDVL